MEVTRRAALVGYAAVAAGCLGSPSGPSTGTERQSPSPTGTDPSTGSPTSSEPAVVEIGRSVDVGDTDTMTVADPSVQGSIIADVGTSLTPSEFRGVQWLVVSINTRRDIESHEFAIERDGAIASPPKQRQLVRRVLKECESTCVGIPFTTGETTEAAVVYQPPDDDVQAAWTLPTDVVSLFDVEPDLALRSAEIVEKDGDLGITFTVENVGPRDAGFRAVVADENLADTTDPVAFPVPVEESRTETVTTLNTRHLDPDQTTFTNEIDATTRYFPLGSR